jgi:hypothetical protein
MLASASQDKFVRIWAIGALDTAAACDINGSHPCDGQTSANLAKSIGRCYINSAWL